MSDIRDIPIIYFGKIGHYSFSICSNQGPPRASCWHLAITPSIRARASQAHDQQCTTLRREKQEVTTADGLARDKPHRRACVRTGRQDGGPSSSYRHQWKDRSRCRATPDRQGLRRETLRRCGPGGRRRSDCWRFKTPQRRDNGAIFCNYFEYLVHLVGWSHRRRSTRGWPSGSTKLTAVLRPCKISTRSARRDRA
jgi:hypothetical protein